MNGSNTQVEVLDIDLEPVATNLTTLGIASSRISCIRLDPAEPSRLVEWVDTQSSSSDS